MFRKILMAVAVLAVVGVIAGIVFGPRRPRWTTSSIEAEAEFRAAMEASRKLYHNEVRTHLERALELDPDFVIAKVMVAESCRRDDPERASALLQEVAGTDLERLNPRERFLVERAGLLAEGRYDEARERVDAYLERFPDDPYVLHIKALGAWQRGELEEAERLNKRLLEIDPNWVIAYNQLGYITMLQGRFPEAEEYFTSYRFIAPDQANPHDSLGELFILLGRYDEARTCLETALETKPDFIPAFEHLAILDALTENWADARREIERAIETGALSESGAARFRCGIEYWQLKRNCDWDAILELAKTECPPEEIQDIGTTVYVHEAACRTGNRDLATAIESKVEAMAKEYSSAERATFRQILVPMEHRMRGTRLLLQGNLEDGIDELREADEGLTYIFVGVGIIKLANRLDLAVALEAAGHEEEAEALIDEVRAVNPLIVRNFEENPSRNCGL